jgi:4-alpha-glucanotransferase
LLYGRDTRLNTPGKSEGNWGYRLTREQLASVNLSQFRDWNRLYGRI